MGKPTSLWSNASDLSQNINCEQDLRDALESSKPDASSKSPTSNRTDTLLAAIQAVSARNTKYGEPKSPTSNRTDTLLAAIQAVSARKKKYGEPEDNFRRWANLVNAYLASRREAAAPLGSTDMAIIAALMKVARLANDPTHQDSWVDLAGYAACGSECGSRNAP